MGARLEEGFCLVVRIRAIEKAEMERDARHSRQTRGRILL